MMTQKTNAASENNKEGKYTYIYKIMWRHTAINHTAGDCVTPSRLEEQTYIDTGEQQHTRIAARFILRLVIHV